MIYKYLHTLAFFLCTIIIDITYLLYILKFYYCFTRENQAILFGIKSEKKRDKVEYGEKKSF